MKISDTKELLGSMPLDIDRLAAAQGEPYRTIVVKAEDLRGSPAELVEEILHRYGAPLREDSGNIRRYREAQDLARGLAGLCAQLKRYEEAATIAGWFAEVHDTWFELFLIGADAAARAGRFDDAAELLGVALRKSFLDNFRDAGHYLRTFVKVRIPSNLGAESACTWPLVPTHLGADRSGATGTRSRRSEATLG